MYLCETCDTELWMIREEWHRLDAELQTMPQRLKDAVEDYENIDRLIWARRHEAPTTKERKEAVLKVSLLRIRPQRLQSMMNDCLASIMMIYSDAVRNPCKHDLMVEYIRKYGKWEK